MEKRISNIINGEQCCYRCGISKREARRLGCGCWLAKRHIWTMTEEESNRNVLDKLKALKANIKNFIYGKD